MFGLFSKEKSLQRTIAKATNKLSQSVDRWAALERLSQDGSDEALNALCQRFCFQSTKMIDDEQEKEWVVETLAEKGESVLPQITRSMRSSATIAYLLRVLGRIASPEQVWATIDTLLADEDPGYTRDTTKRIQIIDWLSEWEGGDPPGIVRRVSPYLTDFDENVRFAAVEAISVNAHPDAAEALIEALLSPEEESRRLKVRIAEVLADSKMPLCGRKAEISPLFDDVLADFRMHHDKLIRKK